jgi:hypothetical protein
MAGTESNAGSPMPALLKDLHSTEKPCAVLLPSVPITGSQQGEIAMAKQPKNVRGTLFKDGAWLARHFDYGRIVREAALLLWG